MELGSAWSLGEDRIEGALVASGLVGRWPRQVPQGMSVLFVGIVTLKHMVMVVSLVSEEALLRQGVALVERD